MSMIDVRHDTAAHRFTALVEGHHAVLDYELEGATMTITHTGVPPAIGGRGVAAELVRAALDTALKAGWTVIPACSCASAYIKRHPHAAARAHQEQLLDEAEEESFPASDSPSVGRSS